MYFCRSVDLGVQYPGSAGRRRRLERHGPLRHLHGVSPPHVYHLETAGEQDETFLQGTIPGTHSVLCRVDLRHLFLGSLYSFCDIGPSGSAAPLHSGDQHVCQRLPDDAAGQRHLDTILYLDGYR